MFTCFKRFPIAKDELWNIKCTLCNIMDTLNAILIQ